MGQWMLVLLGVLVALGFSSCDESFSPKERAEDRTFLYCITHFSRVESTTQLALVSRSYDVEGTDPRSGISDPFEDGAELRLITRGKEHAFTKTVLGPPDTTRYGSALRFYRVRDVVLYPGEAVMVAAYLTDGTVLQGRAVIPPIRPLDTHPRYAVGFTTLVNRFTQGDRYVLDWNDGNHDGHLFIPSMVITYQREDTTGPQSFAVPVPMKFVERNGERVPVYARPSTDMYCAFTFDAIDETVRAIAAGDPEKGRYTLGSLKFSVTECDLALSRYQLSVQGTTDQYALRLDEGTYTNVQGGGGVVGATTTFGINLAFDPRYARTFGYGAE